MIRWIMLFDFFGMVWIGNRTTNPYLELGTIIGGALFLYEHWEKNQK